MNYGSLYQPLLLQRDCTPRIKGYYYKHFKSLSMSFHKHNTTEIMYAVSGECAVELDIKGKIKRVSLKKNEFIIVDANVSHRLIVEQELPRRMLNVEFCFSEGESKLPSIKQFALEEPDLAELIRTPRPYLLLTDPDELYYVLKGLVLELDRQALDAPNNMVDLLFMQLLIRIARIHRGAQTNEQPQASYYIQQCIHFIQQHYDDELTVKLLAKQVNVHPGYLQRIFKQHTGMTMTSYITSVRIEAAKQLLQQSEFPVLDISEHVGIGSRQYFHALFKRYTGHTPLEYRNLTDRQRWNYTDEEIAATRPGEPVNGKLP